MATLKERFLSKVQVCEDGCHQYMGGRDTGGYGQFWIGKRNFRAHRVAYELFVGPIPTGMRVCHSCDYRPCVNPEHLFLGSDQTNVADMIRKGRHPREESNGRAILTARRAAEIKWLVAEGRYSLGYIGSTYGVSSGAVHAIKCERTWRDVEPIKPAMKPTYRRAF